MASSQDHQRTTSAEDASPNNGNDHDGRPPLPPLPMQQQAMGYPPVMGYPPPGQYPHHHPPSPLNNAYPPAPDYYSPHPPPPCLPQQHHHPPQVLPVSRFVRGILAAVVFFIIASCTISIIAYVILHPVNPEFSITGFSVEEFRVMPGVPITGSFEANVTVGNPNEKLRIRFHSIESYVYFKNPVAELAWTTAAPFIMETNMSHVMTVRAIADGDVGGDNAGDDEEVRGDEDAAAAMEKEWRNGTVEMGLMIGMWATFRSENGWWSSQAVMRVQCDELLVTFTKGNGMTPVTGTTGAWTGNGVPKKCIAYR
ncbi:hypothetical protein MLD38_035570 [Melastoma candidum]|uniref:Uncharacterized protein n=1 Tax=Melastoma candidum TaxID=119954 RepID=A0ACB9LHJ0_9MYRT|nr:hypothetical protein MLD38_035570 [Melastoma candidum]